MKGMKSSDAQNALLKKEYKRIMCLFITKFQERSPLKSYIYGCSSYLSPVIIVK